MRHKLKEIGKNILLDVKNYKAALLIFTLYYIFMHVVFHAFCPLVLMTGLPCAGCGMKRAIFFMITGQFLRSWNLNPMALPVILFAAYCVVYRYFLGKSVKGFKIGLIAILLGMMIAYIYRMYTIFPTRPPYAYTPGNIMERLIPHYKHILHRLLGI